MSELKVVNVEGCKASHKWCDNDVCVTIERNDGKRFCVNIPDDRWVKEDKPEPHGLNLAYGDGDHYW